MSETIDHTDQRITANESRQTIEKPRIECNVGEDNTDELPRLEVLESISLLRQIFPDLSNDELLDLHQNRLRKSIMKRTNMESSSPKQDQHVPNQTLSLDQYRNRHDESAHRPLQRQQVQLPEDFLRLPQDAAVRRYNIVNRQWEYHIVADLERCVLKQHGPFLGGRVKATGEGQVKNQNFTRVISRDLHIGLGMTLCERGPYVRVHSVTSKDGSRWYDAPSEYAVEGPAIKAQIHPGDIVLGINGQAFVQQSSAGLVKDSLLRRAVVAIQQSPDPVVIHLRRGPSLICKPMTEKNGLASPTSSLLDRHEPQESSSSILLEMNENRADPPSERKPAIHPFAAALTRRGLVQSVEDQITITHKIAQFAYRARQLESRGFPASIAGSIDNSSTSARPDLRNSAPALALNHNPLQSSLPETNGAPPTFDHDYQNDSQSTGSSRQRYPGSHLGRTLKQSSRFPARSDTVTPQLACVRKALCVRIVNTFLDGNCTAYTIWVYDVESGREWYAPVRYYSDFHDLRAATLPLSPSVAGIPFPKERWSVFGKRGTAETHGEFRCQLEGFLRKLTSTVYRDPLHPNVVDIAIHVQSFLGCDIGLDRLDGGGSYLQHQFFCMDDVGCVEGPEGAHSEAQINARLLLKRSVQQYTYRLFLLDTMERIVQQFVDEARAKGLGSNNVKALESQGRVALKERSLEELERIRTFLDQMQELILEGCTPDLTSISHKRDFLPIRNLLDGEGGQAYWDRLLRESVREQIEIEIYVPVRSVVSNLLVNGWRHDDMEMKFKMQELRKRPQTLFRIPKEKQSTSNWESVSSILNEGVQKSTLPCSKLRAIVNAAKEIANVYADDSCEPPNKPLSNIKGQSASRGSSLGADDFLPIFIYCVVQAEMERPCALCVLLRTLCERSSRIGETGYYLASFEAAIAHISEIDLSKDS